MWGPRPLVVPFGRLGIVGSTVLATLVAALARREPQNEARAVALAGAAGSAATT